MRRSLAEIENMHVHKGKDPVIEIQIGKVCEKLVFQCDYSRQQFIEALIEVKMGRGARQGEINGQEGAAPDNEGTII